MFVVMGQIVAESVVGRSWVRTESVVARSSVVTDQSSVETTPCGAAAEPTT